MWDIVSLCKPAEMAYCLCLADRIPRRMSADEYLTLLVSLADLHTDFFSWPSDLKLTARGGRRGPGSDHPCQAERHRARSQGVSVSAHGFLW
jgi:hypothetical protein